MRFTHSITQNLQARPKVWIHLASSIPSVQSPLLLPGSAAHGSPTPQWLQEPCFSAPGARTVTLSRLRDSGGLSPGFPQTLT